MRGFGALQVTNCDLWWWVGTKQLRHTKISGVSQITEGATQTPTHHSTRRGRDPNTNTPQYLYHP